MKKTSILNLFPLLFGLVFAGFKPSDVLPTASIEDKQNNPETTIRSMLATADKGDMENFMSFWAPKFEVYFNGQLTNADEMKKRVVGFKTGFPGVKRVIDEVLVNGNTVIVRGWMTGTNTGSFMGNPPTGKAIKAHLLCIFKVNVEGKIVAGWVDTDMDALKSQLK